MGGQWVAELALVDGTHVGMAPLSSWASGVAFTRFAVHPALVDVRDVALALCWLRGGWSAGVGRGRLGTHFGSLWPLLALAAVGVWRGRRGGSSSTWRCRRDLC